MKRHALIILALTALTFTACDFAVINKEATEAVHNLNAEALKIKKNVEHTVNTINDATQAINQAGQSIGNAVDAVNQAKDSVEEFTGVELSEADNPESAE